MTNEKATPASAPEPSPSSKKGFTKEWMIATAVGAVALFALWMLGSMGGDGKDTISSSTTNKPAPTQVVAGNTTSTPVKGNIIPASTTKPTTPPATGEVSTAKVDVKAEGGKLKVEFDPCCNCNKPTPMSKVGKHSPKKAAVPASAPKAVAPVNTVAFWGWVHPESSDTKPMACYADRKINGMPARCSSVLVEPSKDGEKEDAWRTRVASLAGIKVGAKTDRGTITATRNADVVVK